MVQYRMGIQFRRTLLLPMLLVALLASVFAAPASADDGSSLANEAARVGVPGGVVAHLERGRVTHVEAFGRAEPTNRFLFGSVSKPIAAAVAQDLADAGRLDLDRPVGESVRGGPDVPARSLLDHTAGLDFGADVLDVDRPGTTATRLLAELPPPALSAAGTHRYSSLGYVYLQALIEQASGTDYGTALRHAVPGTRIGASARECGDLATPHRFVGPWAVAQPGPYDGAGAAYGYTCGSIEDLARFAERHLADPTLADPTPTGRAGTTYANGWRLTTEADGGLTHWHTGTVPGYFSGVFLDPAGGRGAVVLLSASGFLHEEQLAALVRNEYDRVTGRRVTPVPAAPWAVAPVVACLAGALLLILSLSRRSTRRGRRRVLAWGTLGLAMLGIVAVLMLAGPYPPRYVWLWEPGFAVAWGLTILAAAVGVATCLRRRDEPASSTDVG